MTQIINLSYLFLLRHPNSISMSVVPSFSKPLDRVRGRESGVLYPRSETRKVSIKIKRKGSDLRNPHPRMTATLHYSDVRTSSYLHAGFVQGGIITDQEKSNHCPLERPTRSGYISSDDIFHLPRASEMPCNDLADLDLATARGRG